MDKIEIRNAKISGTMLGIEDHGILSFFIYLDYGGEGQGFGGYALDGPDKDNGGRSFSGFGMEIVRTILEVLEVPEWEKLKGTPLRVEASSVKVHRIGHLLKDKWVDIDRIALKYQSKKD